MATGWRSRIDEEFLRAIAATSPAAAQLVAKLKTPHKRGPQPIPEISYRQLARMWRSYQRLHEGTDKELAPKFLLAHERQIKKLLGLNIGRKIEPEQGPWGSLRNAVRRGERARDRIRSRRESTWHFMGRAFGRQKSSFQVIRLGLWRQKQLVDRATAEYLLAQEEAVLLGRKPTALF